MKASRKFFNDVQALAGDANQEKFDKLSSVTGCAIARLTRHRQHKRDHEREIEPRRSQQQALGAFTHM